MQFLFITIRTTGIFIMMFYNDVLGQLYLLNNIGFDRTIPIIVPKKALDLNYVQEFFKTGYAKNWNWIFQDKETYIRLESVYLCKKYSKY